MGMKRKPRRVKEQGSFLKLQLKGLERSGAFKQPWEGGGGGVLAGVQAAVPSGHSFLLNVAAPGPLLLLFQAAIESFPTPASEPEELCSVSSLAARLPPKAPGCARRFDHELLAQKTPGPNASWGPGHAAPEPAAPPGALCQNPPPPGRMDTPSCRHLADGERQLLRHDGCCGGDWCWEPGEEGSLHCGGDLAPSWRGWKQPVGAARGCPGQSVWKAPIGDPEQGDA